MCSLNQSGAGSLQEESGPHPPTLSFHPLFPSLLQLINLPVFPYTKSSLLHKLVSVRISHLSSKILLPLPLLWLVQYKSASAGDWLPTNKANHPDMKGKQPQMNKERVCVLVHMCAHICVYIRSVWAHLCVSACFCLSRLVSEEGGLCVFNVQAFVEYREGLMHYILAFCGLTWPLQECCMCVYMKETGW